MRSLFIKPALNLKGEVILPGDKSIAHRCIIISAITHGKTTIKNFPINQDCLFTLRAFKKLGISISLTSNAVTVLGKGLHGLKKPKTPIFVGDSGTTLRLILGILAAQNFEVTLITGRSLAHRPMLRVIAPLRLMGAQIKAKVKSKKEKVEEYPPIKIRGGKLRPITYTMPVASAQVKSAILLAALYAEGTTRVIEPVPTRDHTERMLNLFRADIKTLPESSTVSSLQYKTQMKEIIIKGNKDLVSPKTIFIPGDISSASFFIVLATILPNSKITIRNINLNPSRIGIIRVLKRMGADIKVTKSLPRLKGDPERSQGSCWGQASHPAWPAGRQVSVGEPMGDLIVKSSKLKGTLITKEEVPSLIDEIPILMVAACCAKGSSIFEAVGELRVKETDRISSMSENLRKMGARVEIIKMDKSEKIVIKGTKVLRGARVKSFGDHRTAMSMVVAALNAKGRTRINDIACINKSFPDFMRILNTLK